MIGSSPKSAPANPYALKGNRPVHRRTSTNSSRGWVSCLQAIRGLSTQKENALRRTRYQDGSLRLRERPGQKTWEYRWYEIQIDGSRTRRSANLGTLQDYPTEAAAMKAASALRANINMETPRAQIQAISFDTLVEHYRLKEMGEGSDKTFATCETYEGYLKKWILPRWLTYRLRDVKSVA